MKNLQGISKVRKELMGERTKYAIGVVYFWSKRHEGRYNWRMPLVERSRWRQPTWARAMNFYRVTRRPK